MFEAERKLILRITTDWSDELWDAVGEVTWEVPVDGPQRFCGEFERSWFVGESRFERPLGQRRKFYFKWVPKMSLGVRIEVTLPIEKPELRPDDEIMAQWEEYKRSLVFSER